MTKELEQIRKRSREIMEGYPEKMEDLHARLEEARNQKAAAEAALEEAMNFDSYNAAESSLKNSVLAVNFIEREMERLETAPRMDEAEYEKAVATCRGIMEAAVSDWRKKAAAIMDQLKALTDEYSQTATEVNAVLVELDQAANVLQSRHQYRVSHYQGKPDRLSRNRDAWKAHALRYDNYRYQKLATDPDPEDKAKEPHVQWDSVLAAAWTAVSKGYPRRAI